MIPSDMRCWLATVFTYKDWNIRFEGPLNYVQGAVRERRINKGRKFDFSQAINPIVHKVERNHTIILEL
jgi:hypothetical protein